MATDSMEETGVLETDAVLVRTMRQDDLNAIVAIDAAASGRRRPRYFELMLQRSITQAGLQISLVAEVDNRVVGFVIGSLYYGEYGVVEPSASIDAISVDPRIRGKNVGKALMRQLRLNLGALRITSLADRSFVGSLRPLGVFQKSRIQTFQQALLGVHSGSNSTGRGRRRLEESLVIHKVRLAMRKKKRCSKGH